MPKKKSVRKKKNMSEEVPTLEPIPAVLTKEKDKTNQVTLSIIRPAQGQVLEVHVRAPVVARIVRSMAMSNYPVDKFEPIYKDILAIHPMDKTGKTAITRAAISRATKNFEGGTDFGFDRAPRAILLANPDKLEEGYILTYKVETPVPPDQLRKWGKQFIDGCEDIVSSARPFRMQWVMDETGPEKK
jgi:hypothetical protein